MNNDIELSKELLECSIITYLRSIIVHIDYPSEESFSLLKIFINAHNELAINDDDTKIGDVMDNKTLIDIMSRFENFNARIISDLYRSIGGKNTTPFFLYSADMTVNDIELIAISSIGEIKSTVCDSLKKIVWAVLKTPENPIFTPIYKMIYQSFFKD